MEKLRDNEQVWNFLLISKARIWLSGDQLPPTSSLPNRQGLFWIILEAEEKANGDDGESKRDRSTDKETERRPLVSR